MYIPFQVYTFLMYVSLCTLRHNCVYFLINSIPLSIIIIIAIYYKNKRFKHINIIEILENYFGIKKTLYNKYILK